MLTSQHQFTTYQSMCTDFWGSRKGILFIQHICFRILIVTVFLYGHDDSENAPQMDVDSFYIDKKGCIFKNIQIHVDEACEFLMQIPVQKGAKELL